MCAMASSHGVVFASTGVPRLARVCCATGIIAAAAVLPLLAGSVRTASAAELAKASGTAPLRLTVSSVSPSYATPGDTITISGLVKNNTRAAMSGLTVRVLSSTTRLTSSIELGQFAAGAQSVTQAPVSASEPLLISHLRAHNGVAWHLRLPVSELRLSCFGVYPLTVTVRNEPGTAMASDPVPLPFWPNKADSCTDAQRPAPFPISWVWPLIDSPHQGTCPGLLDDSLASRLAPGGRLATMLAVGASYASKAELTWAIDPALLDNAQTMTKPYLVSTSSSCHPAAPHPASKDAGAWLKALADATTGHPVFVTPYADVDVAGLAQFGDSTDLRRAFTSGQRLAAPLLGRDLVPVSLPAGPRKLASVAWPADGLANPAVLENFGAMKIGAVILAMPLEPSPPLSYTPGAVTSVNDGVGTKLKVLLSDNTLTGLLASASPHSSQVGTIFSLSQLFLAQTAMIVAEAPAMQRPILVAPPRRWDPASSLAADLLSDTITAPWLKVTTLGRLAAQPAEQDYRSLVPQSFEDRAARRAAQAHLQAGQSSRTAPVDPAKEERAPEPCGLRHRVVQMGRQKGSTGGGHAHPHEAVCHPAVRRAVGRRQAGHPRDAGWPGRVGDCIYPQRTQLSG